MYEKIAGIPIDEYQRQDARKRYFAHPRAPREPKVDQEAVKRVMDLRARGLQHAVAECKFLLHLLNVERCDHQSLLNSNECI